MTSIISVSSSISKPWPPAREQDDVASLEDAALAGNSASSVVEIDAHASALDAAELPSCSAPRADRIVHVRLDDLARRVPHVARAAASSLGGEKLDAVAAKVAANDDRQDDTGALDGFDHPRMMT